MPAMQIVCGRLYQTKHKQDLNGDFIITKEDYNKVGGLEGQIDAHVDTVGVGERSEWKQDPYKGKVADGKVWGRGAGDQEGAIPAMAYAAKILRDLKVDMSEFSLLLTFTVMEEDCDGLCWHSRCGNGPSMRRTHR